MSSKPMPHEINIHLVRMPCKVRAAHTINTDGTWSVFLNDRLTCEQCRASFRHELRHILHGDLLSDEPADVLEAMRR